MSHRNEPSVEEILESIKRVIDRENRQTLQGERRRREIDGVRHLAPAEQASKAVEDNEAEPHGRSVEDHGDPATTGLSDVLDLGSAAMTLEEDPEEDFAEDFTENFAADRAADLDASRNPAGELACAEPETGRENSPAAASSLESLVSEQAAHSMQQSLAALAMLARPADGPGDEPALQEMVRDMLRPMLAQWLDDHLPEMVERLVKAEIVRIAGLGR